MVDASDGMSLASVRAAWEAPFLTDDTAKGLPQHLGYINVIQTWFTSNVLVQNDQACLQRGLFTARPLQLGRS